MAIRAQSFALWSLAWVGLVELAAEKVAWITWFEGVLKTGVVGAIVIGLIWAAEKLSLVRCGCCCWVWAVCWAADDDCKLIRLPRFMGIELELEPTGRLELLLLLLLFDPDRVVEVLEFMLFTLGPIPDDRFIMLLLFSRFDELLSWCFELNASRSISSSIKLLWNICKKTPD